MFEFYIENIRNFGILKSWEDIVRQKIFDLFDKKPYAMSGNIGHFSI